MLTYVLPVCFGMLSIALIFVLVRLVKGPSLPDRALALDTVSVVAMATIILFGIWKDSKVYFEIALLISVISYISTVAVAKFILRGDIIE